MDRLVKMNHEQLFALVIDAFDLPKISLQQALVQSEQSLSSFELNLQQIDDCLNTLVQCLSVFHPSHSHVLLKQQLQHCLASIICKQAKIEFIPIPIDLTQEEEEEDESASIIQ
jgi:hypothetical protein